VTNTFARLLRRGTKGGQSTESTPDTSAEAAAPEHSDDPEVAAKAPAAIVNTASTNGLVAEPRLAHYNTSKGGLVMLTKSMAIDLAPLGIRVNAVAPGVIATPLIEHILAAETADHFGSIPAGRVGQPEEIAACIAFLASDEASYCHGTVLVCDGGQLAINGELPETAVTDAGPR